MSCRQRCPAIRARPRDSQHGVTFLPYLSKPPEIMKFRLVAAPPGPPPEATVRIIPWFLQGEVEPHRVLGAFRVGVDQKITSLGHPPTAAKQARQYALTIFEHASLDWRGCDHLVGASPRFAARFIADSSPGVVMFHGNIKEPGATGGSGEGTPRANEVR